jgi:hypothetical protein
MVNLNYSSHLALPLEQRRIMSDLELKGLIVAKSTVAFGAAKQKPRLVQVFPEQSRYLTVNKLLCITSK